MKILILDEDRELIAIYTYWLRTNGFEARGASAAARAYTEWLEYQPSLVIVSRALPDVDVVAMCSELQRKHDALLLMTASARDNSAEIDCLMMLADDFLVKPYSPQQLLAHVTALARRTQARLTIEPSSIANAGHLRVDASHNIAYVHGRIVRLSPTEARLAYLLAENANRVCTKEQIIIHLWGYDGDGTADLIKSHIRRLRMKLEVDPNHPCLIITVPNVGYMLARQPAASVESEDFVLSRQVAL